MLYRTREADAARLLRRFPFFPATQVWFKASPAFLFERYPMEESHSLMIRMKPTFNTGLFAVRPNVKFFGRLYADYSREVVESPHRAVSADPRKNPCDNEQCWLYERRSWFAIVRMDTCDNDKSMHELCRRNTTRLHHYMPSYERPLFERLQAEARTMTCHGEDP